MVTIRTREQLRTAKRAIKKLVLDALSKVPREKLITESWNQGPVENPTQVCLVGAIGVASYDKNTDNKPDYFDPFHVVPLIKNGTSRWVDDMVLTILSDGFEKCSNHRTKYANGRWEKEFFQWLWEVGNEVRMYAGYNAHYAFSRRHCNKNAILGLKCHV